VITGFLLMYIGYRFTFPALYFVGCWMLIIIRAFDFTIKVYQKGKESA
jgi:hypothetical protein